MPVSFSRLRRYRQNATIRALVQDSFLSPQDFILPVFIQAQEGRTDILQMPYAQRLGPKALLRHIEKCCEQGILAIALFPLIEEDKKTLCAKEAWNPEGLIPTAIQILKTKFPELCIIADIALDPFHLAGQDGICSETGTVLNDPTLDALCKQALCYAQAGADILAPSDMMDGRVLRIRDALESEGLIQTLILSYCIKFASHLYGPFRHAVDSSRFLCKADKKTYQMDYRCAFQIFKEAAADANEGADFLMVKPGLHYLDAIQTLSKNASSLPVWAYHVSGECSMLWYGAQQGLFDFEPMLLETLWAIRRAGASKILTYFAYEACLALS
jgi:porphobilinogen synthase